MTDKHTKGTWVVRSTASGNPFIYEAATGKVIAGVSMVAKDTPRVESEANARLIACAPELLAALDNLLTAADHNGVTHLYENRQGNPHVPRCAFGDALAEARAAIAKARGG